MSAVMHLDDCLEVMRGMADGSVDHVITDPPFGQIIHAGARSESKATDTQARGKAGGVKLIHFDSFSDAEFVGMARECVRIARRWVIMTCDWRHAVAAEKEGLPVIRVGVWIKEGAAPQFTGDRPGTGWDAVLILHRPGRKRWNGGGYHAVWKAKVVRGNHPTEKPVALIGQWITQFTEKGELIFDPFAGSGSTGVAAVGMGREFVGVELDPAYHATAVRRIANAQPALLGIG